MNNYDRKEKPCHKYDITNNPYQKYDKWNREFVWRLMHRWINFCVDESNVQAFLNDSYRFWNNRDMEHALQCECICDLVILRHSQLQNCTELFGLSHPDRESHTNGI